MLLNHLSAKLDLPYDKDGAVAANGQINEALLEKLNALEYYRLPPPKSTGYEWFHSEILPLVDSTDMPVEDLLHTSVHHIAQQIRRQLYLHTNNKSAKLLITGGGAYNGYLIKVLKEEIADRVEVVLPSSELISFKEAMIFAFMGALRLSGEINVLSSVTGAAKDSCSGIIFNPA